MSFARPIVVVLLLVILGLLALRQSWDPAADPVVRSRLLMGTVVEITALQGEEGRLEEAVSAAFAEMERIERLMSPHIAGSDVARLTASGEGGEVAPETAEVIKLGREVARRSGGAFDMTLGRLKALWGIEGENPRVPGAQQIRSALEGVGPDALKLEGRRVIKQGGRLAVDLGGIAKGYAIDRAVAVLEKLGVSQASVNAGGDMRLLGDRSGRPWRIAIQHPRREGELLAVLSLSDTAVVTSGDYERFFEQGGRRYHHLFDPRTGYPASSCQSVTVVAPSAALADALATAVFVLGPEKGMALLERWGDVEGLVVSADGSVGATPGLEGQVEWR